MGMNTTWTNLIDPHPVARSAAVSTFTAYQDVTGAAATNPLPQTGANDLKMGTKVEIEAWGQFSTTGTPTLVIGGIYNATVGAAGGTAFAQSTTITTGTTAAAWPWHYNAHGIVTATGTSGVLYIQGILDLGTSLTAYAAGVPCPITAAARSVTIDTTITAKWAIGAAWSASSASNTITVDMFAVKVLNQGKT